jgi:hypothetical protein
MQRFIDSSLDKVRKIQLISPLLHFWLSPCPLSFAFLLSVWQVEALPSYGGGGLEPIQMPARSLFSFTYSRSSLGIFSNSLFGSSKAKYRVTITLKCKVGQENQMVFSVLKSLVIIKSCYNEK